MQNHPRKIRWVTQKNSPITIGLSTKSYGKIDVLSFMEHVYSPREFAINTVALYESQLLPTGINYKVLTQFPLN